MNEQPEQKPESLSANFIFPSAQNEYGEIERVGKTFNQGPNNFAENFILRSFGMMLKELPEDIWAKLENTDSADIAKGDWETVAYHAGAEHRDWQSLKQKMEIGVPIDAPIIAEIKGRFHLVSGNTRLMVARALGIIPKVLIVDM